MCSNYQAVSRESRLINFFGVTEIDGDTIESAETYPLGLAPFIRLSDGEGEEGGRPALVSTMGQFGLLPPFAAEQRYGKHTYNARSETVASKPSFRGAWKAGHRCIVPAELVFEHNHETGKAVRYAIQQPGSVPMGIAGIYWRWKNPTTGELSWTFAMLTVNADGHPIFSRMHRPGDEKRMPVILREEDYGPWLMASVAEAPRFFLQYTGLLDAHPAPKRGRGEPKDPPADPVPQDLF